MILSLVVFGTPEPKGSTRAFVRKMGDTYRAVTTSDNPNLRRWEQLVRFEAQATLRKAGLATSPFFNGPVAIRARFGLMRPPSVSARKRPHPTVKPDLDKLLRGCVDALIGVLFRDDAQVVKFLDPEKFYVPDGRPAFAEIAVMAYPDPPLFPGVIA